MYNIINHVEDVFKILKQRGFSYEVPRQTFITELKRSTSIFSEKTLNNWIKNFAELGYIRIKNSYTFELCKDFHHPYEFESDKVVKPVPDDPEDIEKEIARNIENVDKVLKNISDNAKISKEK